MTHRDAGGTPVDGKRAEQIEELAALGVLTASLLHELRQPLFAMRGRLQLARQAGREIGVEDTRQLLNHLAHIEDLVEHHAGLGRPHDTWLEMDLAQEVTRAMGMLVARIRQSRAAVHTTLADGIGVRGRSVALRQVVLNLVTNALDAVTTLDGERHVHVVLEATEDGRPQITVTDNGPGIPAAVRDRLFEPFVTTKPSGVGTGLGMFISKRLLVELGGTIVVEPLAQGTRVRVTLPAQ